MSTRLLFLASAIFLAGTGVHLSASAAISPDQAAASSERTRLLAQGSTPEQTYMTPQNANEIAIQITDGEFYFYDIMYRTYGNYFTAANSGVRVTYDRDTGTVLVINSVTGTEFYNYSFSEPNSSSGSSTAASSSPTPVTYMTPRDDDQIDVQITEGEFRYDGTLTRSSGNIFTGSDAQVRVIYDRDASRIVVLNVVTGTEFYNYVYSEVDEGYL